MCGPGSVDFLVKLGPVLLGALDGQKVAPDEYDFLEVLGLVATSIRTTLKPHLKSMLVRMHLGESNRMIGFRNGEKCIEPA